MKANDGGPAFPLFFPAEFNQARKVVRPRDEHPGMSLRDYFAAQVIGMASHDLTEPALVAKRAYLVADAMLAERQVGAPRAEQE